ncbi:Fpg/Nei family DNA glycosylase [Bacillus salacetis]|uniref:Formamidopyrimidine-DNA glycosylase n=1 Tax=Bacillus salacetis TaxID=2315464 RepID=A0A3A1R5I9_9BACI|nr:DNA-formamidopyrimidine glycosylase family protein [Bacillus salacetis]RIW38300.1 Fpg/Nei family DNA glycosylase [Bacillus salacetis]
MPELPEMENYKILLMQRISGQQITHVEIGREKSINVPTTDFIRLVQNHSVKKVTRRAKHLLFHLDNDVVLLLHLMLGGWMFFGQEQDKPDRTVQIRLSFRNENLYFIGLRLGYLHLYEGLEYTNKELDDLGPEPLSPEFTAEQFIGLAGSRRGSLKATLVNQGFLSGIGNCYSDEMCFYAGLHPARKLNQLSKPEAGRLYHSMQFILKDAIGSGGYMSEPFHSEDKLTGGYNRKCLVYDREGEPCPRCGNEICKTEISSKKTFYCSNCQK